MNRSGSRDLSAIEERLIGRAERSAQIRAEMAVYAARIGRDRTAAAMLSSFALVDDTMDGRRKIRSPDKQDTRFKSARIKGDVEDMIQDRDPCFTCAVRKDKHAEFGCKRWRR